MFDNNCRGKIKIAKIQAWRAELSMYTHRVQNEPGSENAEANALFRFCGAIGHKGVDRGERGPCPPKIFSMYNHFVL